MSQSGSFYIYWFPSTLIILAWQSVFLHIISRSAQSLFVILKYPLSIFCAFLFKETLFRNCWYLMIWSSMTPFNTLILRFHGGQFLCLKYFLAKVHTKQNNLLNRKLFLEMSIVHFTDYLRQCTSLRILEGDDIYNDEEDEVCNDKNSGYVSCSSLLSWWSLSWGETSAATAAKSAQDMDEAAFQLFLIPSLFTTFSPTVTVPVSVSNSYLISSLCMCLIPSHIPSQGCKHFNYVALSLSVYGYLPLCPFVIICPFITH